MNKGKAMKATWSDNDESRSKEDEEIEEMANLCLMDEENDSSSIENEEVYDLYTFDKLQEAFDELSSKFEELGSRHIALKKKVSKLKAKVKTLEKENEVLVNEKCALKKSVDDFSLIATKLTKRKENLEKLLGSQKQSLSKHDLGYTPFTKRKSSKKIFVKQGFSNDDACSFCGLNGRYAYSCKLRQSRFVGIKWIWLQKEQSYPT